MPVVYIVAGAFLCLAAFIGSSMAIIKHLEHRYAKRLAQARDAPDTTETEASAALTTHRRPEDDDPSAPRSPTEPPALSNQLHAPLAAYITSNDLDATMNKLGAALPSLVRHQAQHSRRSEADIVHDLFDRVIEALEVNWRRTSELRIEQAREDVTEVWVAAYPFLDHIRIEHGGMYETVRDNLCHGTRYVYFQPDRRYFEILHAMLAADPEIARVRVALDENDPDSAVRFVETTSDLLKLAAFSIWNPKDPRRMEVVALPYHQTPIRVSDQDGMWRVLSTVTMFEVKSRAQAEVLYEVLKPFYEQAMNVVTENRNRRSAGA